MLGGGNFNVARSRQDGVYYRYMDMS